MEYVIYTYEEVTGKYLVEADSSEEAQAKFEANPRKAGEQISYSAFAISVERVERTR